MTLVDSHCHLDDEKFDTDREAAIERARAAGVERLMAIGTGEGPPDLEAALRLARKYDFIYATVGVHPHDAAKSTPETLARLAELATDSRFWPSVKSASTIITTFRRATSNDAFSSSNWIWRLASANPS